MAKRSSKSRKPRSSSSSASSRKKPVESSSEEEVEDVEDVAATGSSKRRRTASQKRKSNAQKLDSRKPKKPPTAFFYFLEDFRKVYQEQNPKIKSMREIGKAGGEKWKTMAYEEKVQYYDIATTKRAEFDIAMAEYNKKQETGESQHSEDSEFDGE
ncbi:hypothetical protein Dimus_031006 [Dionaea muscipula]